jgi:hypothetical protein
MFGRSSRRKFHPPYGLLDRTILVVLLIFCVTEIFEGILRFYLSALGVPQLIYVPKILMLWVVLGVFLKALYSYRSSAVVVGTFLLFGLSTLVGVLFVRSWTQALFGLWIFLPLVFGILAGPSFARMGSRIAPYVYWLFFLVAIGVIYDYFVSVPWAGVSYEIGGVELSTSRIWMALGIERVAGFSGASFAAAAQLLFLGSAAVVLGKSRVVALFVWLIAGALIGLTTTKTTFGVFLFLTLLLPLTGTKRLPSQVKGTVLTVAPIFVALVGIALPLSTLFVNYRLSLSSWVARFLFASFEDRLTWSWPSAISLVREHGSLLLGRGVGGIGPAAKLFEPSMHTPGDSLYVFLYATFGIISVVLIGAYALKLATLRPKENGFERLIWVWGVAILMNGWANSGVTGPLGACALGITFRYLFWTNTHIQRLRSAAAQSIHGAREIPSTFPAADI